VLILTPSDFSVAPAAGLAALLDWTSSGNGEFALDHGTHCAASLLPSDDDVVLVLPPRVVSWHRVNLPKVANAKLRAVLDGLLEDRLLSDTTDLHFALQPGGRAGQTLWVAACRKSWLRSWLQVLEAAGRPVSRIVPALWPLPPLDGPASDTNQQPAPTLHWAHDEGHQVWLATANPLGVRCTPLQDHNNSTFGDSAFGGLASSTGSAPSELLHTDPETTRLLADPSVAALAEQVFNQRFELVSRSDWLLQCAQSDWNLAQFDFSLTSGARRGQRLRQNLRRWRSSPAWRPARWGLAALVAVQLLGLNVAAWSERNSLQTKQAAVRQTLQQSFPQVSLVLDAPVQMQRELSKLQQASGVLSSGDLETMLGALATGAAGSNVSAPSTVGFIPGEGKFGGWQTDEQSLRGLQQSLDQSGWRTQFDGNELTLRPSNR
jgi:general secretion pathway protein L